MSAAAENLGTKCFKRTLYMCAYPPSGIAGAAVILRNLFQDFPADHLWMLLAQANVRWAEQVDGQPLPWCYETAPWPAVEGRLIWRLRYPVRTALIPLITAKAVRMIKQHRIEAIFSVLYYGEFFVAAYLAHRLTGRPLHAYIMDDWLSNARRHGRTLGWLAERCMPHITRGATRLWAISPAMAEEWRQQYGVRANILWHSVDLEAFRRARAACPHANSNGRLVVVNLGSIYGVNHEPLHNLLSAIRELRGGKALTDNIRLRLYTAQPTEWLEQMGIMPEPWLEITQANPDQIPRVLANANVVFLPLAFDERWSTVVSTAFPTKLAEYLASGTPILVHAPAYATAATYVRQHECGLVVDTPDPHALATALQRLGTDTTLRARLSANAVSAAERHHDRRKVVTEFLRTFTT